MEAIRPDLISSILGQLLNKSGDAETNIDNCTNQERIAIRTKAIESGVTELPKNLYYNYQTQSCIWGPDFPSKPNQ